MLYSPSGARDSGGSFNPESLNAGITSSPVPRARSCTWVCDGETPLPGCLVTRLPSSPLLSLAFEAK